MPFPIIMAGVAIGVLVFLFGLAVAIGVFLQFLVNRFSAAIIECEQQAEQRRPTADTVAPLNETYCMTFETDEFGVYS